VDSFLGFGCPQSSFIFEEFFKSSASSTKLLCLISLLLYLILVNVRVIAIFLLVVIVGKHLFIPSRCYLGSLAEFQ
jgi:hypothetical protein